jgi:hypothetical protein
MLRHIVMWKFNEGVDSKAVGEEIKKRILTLCDSMPEAKRGEVVYIPLSTSTHDIILSVDVDDEEALQKYATSKEHVDIAETLIKPNTNSRVAIDYLF